MKSFHFSPYHVTYNKAQKAHTQLSAEVLFIISFTQHIAYATTLPTDYNIIPNMQLECDFFKLLYNTMNINDCRQYNWDYGPFPSVTA